MKGLMKIIGMILGILGLSAKATAKKKAKVKKIDTKVKQIKKAKATVQKRKASVQTKIVCNTSILKLLKMVLLCQAKQMLTQKYKN